MTRCTVMIIHYTFGWSQNCIKSFQEHLPNERLVVFDNNPHPHQKVEKTRRHKPEYWSTLCQQERKWIKKRSELVEIPRPKRSNLYTLYDHGKCLDFILSWCKNNRIKQFIHIEPDCLIKSNKWHAQLQSQLYEGWGAGFKCSKNLPIHICGSIWNVEAISNAKLSFQSYNQYNTGQHLIHQCLRRGKLKIIPKSRGFLHLCKGTCRNHKWIYLL